jgi:hypothetical protein
MSGICSYYGHFRSNDDSLVFMLFKRQKLHNKLSQLNKFHKHKGTHLYLNELEIIFF